MVHLTLFLIFGVICVAGAVNLIAQKHPINSALSLVVVMGALAGLYLLLGAEFLAAIQVIVYAGAIMVLFVFTIMLLNAGEEEHTRGSKIALIFGVPSMIVGSVSSRGCSSSAYRRRRPHRIALRSARESDTCSSATSCCPLKSPQC